MVSWDVPSCIPMSNPTSLAVSLARKAKQVLETKTDDETLLQSLTALSTLDNGEAAHPSLLPHQLSSAIEAGSLRCATDLLQCAEGVMQQLTLLQKGVSDLRSCSDRIRNEIECCASSTTPYLESIESLEAAEKLNQEKEKLVDDFLHRYQLLPEEAALLQSGDVTEAFFQTLQRAQSIHANCKNLLRTQHQRAGLELMDTMARYQEAALKRLVQWIQLKCQELVDVEAAELDPLMQQALQALSARPVLYRYCAEEVAEARHDALFERFVSSLWQGPRPIGMQSDDPKRFLNDMLAWVHQSLASEIELLELLFKEVRGVHEEPVKELPSITDLLDRIFHSIDRPLKARIEQVLMLPPAPVLCFELGRLLEFYVGVIRDVAGNRFTLVESLQSCLDMAVRTLHEQIHSRGVRLSRNALVIPRDLSPPPEVTDTVQFLLQILAVSDSALKASESDEALSVASIVTSVLNPLLATCSKCASDLENDSLHQENPIKMILSKSIFLINCLDVLTMSLDGRAVIAEKRNELQQQLESRMHALATEVSHVLLRQCGLSVVLDRVKEYSAHDSAETPMAHDPSMHLAAVSKPLQQFFALISEPDKLPEFSAIRDADIKNSVNVMMCRILTDAYEHVYNTVSDPIHGYGPRETVQAHIEHSPEDIKTILSVK